MKHIRNMSNEASTDEPASPSTGTAGGAGAPGRPPDPYEQEFASDAEAKAYWAGVTHGLRCTTGEIHRDDDEPPAPRNACGETAEILDPSGRRLRCDGWLPVKKARFLLVLVAGGVVADACRAVGMSVTSAYALRNRRSGRAFGLMWDAILVHRARGRLADNNLSRAMNGYVEQLVREGVVVAERRRFDNRLSMAMLTRLDGLAASRSGKEAELLRALSEDLDDYVELIEAGGDEDAFVEARRPAPELETEAQADQPLRPPAVSGDGAGPAVGRDWRDVDPGEIPVDGLDPDRMHAWTADERIRAERSHYLDWLDTIMAGDRPLPLGSDCPAAFDRDRLQFLAGMEAGKAVQPDRESERLASSPSLRGPEDEGAWQPSTSSTSPVAAPSPPLPDAGDGGAALSGSRCRRVGPG
ncbi:MAG TPA: hypothetical protein VFZ91_09560 [Allosphingosinicella sp.]